MRLEDYGFKFWDVNDTNVTYSKDGDYETKYIRIDFKHKTIEYYAKDEDGITKQVDDGIHVDIIKASIAVLESGKIEIDFNGGK